jgi:hypothetical protein
VIGVDPGGRETGVVLRANRECARAVVVVRELDEFGPYLREVVELLAELGADHPVDVRPLLLVEGISHPGGRNREGKVDPINVSGLVDAGKVLGAILYAYPGAIEVPPGGHGKGPLLAYPPELVGARERAGAGRLRHARSAWDVSFAAVQAAARVPAPTGRRAARR